MTLSSFSCSFETMWIWWNWSVHFLLCIWLHLSKIHVNIQLNSSWKGALLRGHSYFIGNLWSNYALFVYNWMECPLKWATPFYGHSAVKLSVPFQEEFYCTVLLLLLYVISPFQCLMPLFCNTGRASCGSISSTHDSGIDELVSIDNNLPQNLYVY